MILVTTNFGFAAWLEEIKGFELLKNSNKEGIQYRVSDSLFEDDLKKEYYKSDFSKYNNKLRKIIFDFKNS